MWVLFHIYFLLPVILASVYLNSLKHIKSQLCKITPGNHRQGESTPWRNNACFQNPEPSNKDGERAVGKRY